MNADQIISHIGKGMRAALDTSERFLGADRLNYENAKINVEYLITVKVASQFAEIDHVVRLEPRMDSLREAARVGSVQKNPHDRQRIKRIQSIFDSHKARNKFGKKDRQKLDLSVQTDRSPFPFLLSELKIHAENVTRVKADIDRVFRLLEMYGDLDCLSDQSIYGVCAFHLWIDGEKREASVQRRCRSIISKLEKYLASKIKSNSLFRYKAGWIPTSTLYSNADSVDVDDGDGGSYSVAGRSKLRFIPGVAILGNADDIAAADLRQEPEAG